MNITPVTPLSDMYVSCHYNLSIYIMMLMMMVIHYVMYAAPSYGVVYHVAKKKLYTSVSHYSSLSSSFLSFLPFLLLGFLLSFSNSPHLH